MFEEFKKAMTEEFEIGLMAYYLGVEVKQLEDGHPEQVQNRGLQTNQHTGLVSRYMENPTTTHFKAAKRILRYLKVSDWAGDNDDRKSTSGYVFYMGDTVVTWMFKKQPIVTLSTCEAEYVVATFSVCHEIQIEYVKSQDQVADIFTKPLKHEEFIKIRTLLGMTNQV
ncbi:hypothetical protein SASPL_147106 [Salvia splendens]|uniref:Reverse transcriptase Ty1/copia-type domain-containing protein n=1 Tax=Salvia splendens TaxID=180675 RepID=A0A8X8Z676_SALSN|nr:hypothetical protein SASPL_147106 [Salvia splendens]